jgi:hypothetical protein
MVFSFPKIELKVEVISEAELNAIVADLKAVGEVVSFAPLEFAADHYVLGGITQQVDQGILAAVKIGWEFQRRVIYFQLGIPEAGAKLFAPITVVECQDA